MYRMMALVRNPLGKFIPLIVPSCYRESELRGVSELRGARFRRVGDRRVRRKRVGE